MYDSEMIKNIYKGFRNKIDLAKSLAQRPLTFTEKIVYGHGAQFASGGKNRYASRLELYPDRLALQDFNADTILLQYASHYNRKTPIPASLHCDHLIVANKGSEHDLESAIDSHKEVFDFLESASRKYGLDFWKPGLGIIHQIVLERYAFPGGIVVGSNPHMSHAGGLGMLGFAVSESECLEILCGSTWELKFPKIIGVKLVGQLKGWATPKDVILHLADILNAHGAIIEYFGEGVSSISTSGRAAICNFGTELGALSSVFPYDLRSEMYLRATSRDSWAELARGFSEYLKADSQVEAHPDTCFDQLHTVNLSEIEPMVHLPLSPTRVVKLTNLAETVHKNNYPEKITAAFLGSCNHTSYEDFARLSHLARQVLKHGLKAQCPLYISIGSSQVKAALENEGLLNILQDVGATILANSCGPCAGQWIRQDVHFGEKNSIIASFNKNGVGKYDGNPGTYSFLTSPEIALAMALSGKLTFNPVIDLLFNQEGLPIKLEPPSGSEFPQVRRVTEFKEISTFDSQEVELLLSPASQRLKCVPAFPAWDGEDVHDLRILTKIKGPCSTEHISPSGKWVRYKGHLDLLSDNFLAGASNAFRSASGKGKNFLSNDIEPFSKIAKSYNAKGLPWVLIADENYGDGPLRDIAALEFRYLGGKVVVAKSFAKAHEISLKKQGVLTLTFSASGDYDKIMEDDTLSIEGLKRITANSPLTLIIKHTNRSQDTVLVHHSYSESQIEWFKAGSLLNSLLLNI